VLVGKRCAFVEDATVNTTAEVFDKLSEQSPIDATDLTIEVDSDDGHAPRLRQALCRSCSYTVIPKRGIWDDLLRELGRSDFPPNRGTVTPMTKRLALCCDGTLNTPDEMRENHEVCTNVAKFAVAVASTDALGREQRMFYDKGVGTASGLDPLFGGAFGYGLSQKVIESYMFIVDNFEPGDELFILGFSRGAYTARSTAGLIRSAGVLKRWNAGRIDEAYALYRDRSNTVAPRTREATLFRQSFSTETRIKFIGVWDTVGSLGIPKLINLQIAASSKIPLPSLSSHWDFHDVTLSSYVDNAYHALALDEHRKPFTPTLWNQQSDLKVPQVLEQVWFSGAHSNVGGGYLDTGLSDIALLWMMDKARAVGMHFETSRLAASNITVSPRMGGTLYKSMSWVYERLGQEPRCIPPQRLDAEGKPMITNEYVASTAQARAQGDPDYAAPNLRAYLRRGGPIMDVPLSVAAA